ncbi:MAG TPA: thioredoxin domain-containing protein [Planctomycetota bacterium]
MPKHTNRLAKEKSPYLLQHAHNPVDWYPWGEEAFAKAKKENKPIFLSIGYATCHWCHVMERESFESEDVAAVLNEKFVAIKVDREERPDVDQIYMAAVQAMGQHGGWPLSVWLTPDLKPWMGGTYYPKEDKFGRPGFKSLLLKLDEFWKTKRGEIDESSKALAEHLAGLGKAEPGAVAADDVLRRGVDQFTRRFEPKHGGFSESPKFPHSTSIQFLLRKHKRDGSAEALAMAEKSLEGMAKGGIYDQLGGGFSRYSTDTRWLVPHFEKMLYDNALLTTAYLEAYQITKKPLYARIARETLDYVLRDMTSKDGGFYSAEDADSEKIEGKFYVWTPKEVRDVLGPKADAFMKAFDVTDEGNWEPHEENLPKHKSVLHVAAEGDFTAEKKALFEARAKRVRPGLDDKVLTAWNGLMISAFTQGARVLGEDRYRQAAEKAAAFLLTRHRKDGKLLRTSREGEAKLDGTIADYAYFSAALLDLYETTFDPAYYEEGRRLAEKAVDLFWDEKAGGFFVTPAGEPHLLARLREEHEGPMPTGNAVLALVFLRLFGYTGEAGFRERAEKTVNSFKEQLDQVPSAQPTLLMAVDWLKGPAREIVLAGEAPEALLGKLRATFLPNTVLARADGKSKIPLLEGKIAVNGKAAAYVCENMACKAPVTDVAALEEALKK